MAFAEERNGQSCLYERFADLSQKLDPADGELQWHCANQLQQVREFLTRHPQRDAAGRIKFLVTSGFAAQLQTGIMRVHQDIDLIGLDDASLEGFRRWHGDGDWVRYDSLHGDMMLNPDFLRETAVGVFIQPENFEVLTVSPAVNLFAKLADDEDTGNEFVRGPQKPRINDIFDAVAILCSEYPYQSNWQDEAQTVLVGLAPESMLTVRRRLDLLRVATLGKNFREAFLYAGLLWREQMPRWTFGLTNNFCE
ncbi:hypothetical protein HYZ06_00565 [Candidatus Daviesbacteria bacterium]|nr:hypothetical protein [Candidatus Daviesbacteria bacterium]